MKKRSYWQVVRVDRVAAILCAVIALGGCGEKDNKAEDQNGNAETEIDNDVDADDDNRQEGDGQNESAVPETGSGNGEASHSGNPSGSLAEVFIYDDTHADFVFYGDGSVAMQDITGLGISFGNYQAGLNDFGGDDLQCSIWTDSGNGSHSICNEGVADYNIDSDGITIHVDMSGVPGFSFGDISGDCDVHYESGGNGGPVITLAWEDVVNPERYTAQSQTTQNGNDAGNGAAAGQDDRGQAQTGAESAVNTVLSQAAGHYVQGNGLGSLDLVDHGNGSYSLENIHVVYKVQVGEFPNTQWEDREWRGSTGSFGDGNGARNGGDGIVRLTLNLIDGNKTVTITSQGGIAIDNNDGSGLDFVKVD